MCEFIYFNQILLSLFHILSKFHDNYLNRLTHVGFNVI